MKIRFLLLSFLILTGAKAQVTNGLLYHFTFDNTLSSSTSNSADFTMPYSTYQTDRKGVANGCIYSNLGGYASLDLIPTGNSPRTISIWTKLSSKALDNQVFVYGTGQQNKAYGLSVQPNTVNNYGYANDVVANYTLPLNTWVHIVTTFDSNKNAKIYINGELKVLSAKTDWNTANSLFLLGRVISNAEQFNGSFDDLKIFNRALTYNEVQSLFTGNTPLEEVSGLLAYYSFDQNYNDQNGKHPMTLMSEAGGVSSVAGRYGNGAVAFDGTNGGLQNSTLSNYLSGAGDEQFSICFWQKDNGQVQTNYSTMLELWGGYYYRYETNALTTGRGYPYNGSANWNSVNNSTYSLNDQVWKHIAIVHDPILGKDKFYQDGILVPSLELTIGYENLYKYNNLITIGSGSTNTSLKRYKGTIDEVYIYKGALTQSQIQSIKNNTFLSSLPTHIDKNIQTSEIALYPNPATDQLFITNSSDEPLSIAITNSKGLPIYKQTITSRLTTIPIEQFPKGMYIVHATGNKLAKPLKFIKK